MQFEAVEFSLHIHWNPFSYWKQCQYPRRMESQVYNALKVITIVTSKYKKKKYRKETKKNTKTKIHYD